MGDLAELDALPEDSPLLPMVTSHRGELPRQRVPVLVASASSCRRAQRAQAADIVVVNHHLLLADLALKQEGFGEILPGRAGLRGRRGAPVAGPGRAVLRRRRWARGRWSNWRATRSPNARTSPASLATVQAPARELEQAVRALRAAMDELPVRGTRGRALQDAPVREALSMR